MLTLLLWLATLLTEPDLRRLASEDFATREDAEERLRGMGALALPALCRAAVSDAPDARLAADRLLAPWRRAWMWLRAAGALVGRDAPDADEFYQDKELRRYAGRLADTRGCQGYALLPENESYWWADPVKEVNRYLTTRRQWMKAPPPFAPRPREVRP